MPIEDKIKKIIADTLKISIESVVPEASLLDDLGADSIHLTELIMTMEDNYEIDISDEDAEKIRTVGDAIDYVNAHT